ncbi:MAG: hypothetical protein IJT28_08230 [Bacteroidaceae bacterium]|nr:hypothetical protein [Bacteroidaceae bacterium]
MDIIKGGVSMLKMSDSTVKAIEKTGFAMAIVGAVGGVVSAIVKPIIQDGKIREAVNDYMEKHR